MRRKIVDSTRMANAARCSGQGLVADTKKPPRPEGGDGFFGGWSLGLPLEEGEEVA
jgi:hypothetical protein